MTLELLQKLDPTTWAGLLAASAGLYLLAIATGPVLARPKAFALGAVAGSPAIALLIPRLSPSVAAALSVLAIAALIAAGVQVGAWRSARSARRASTGDDILLGYRHEGPRTAINPVAVCLPVAGQFTNTHILGATGSGKTQAFLYPILEQILAKHRSNPDHRPAVVLVDIKGDLAQKVIEIAARHGRADDVDVITPGGATTYNLLGDAKADVLAGRLLAALRAGDRGVPHPFYAAVEEQMVRAGLEGLEARSGVGGYSIKDLARFVRDPNFQRELAEYHTPNLAAFHQLMEPYSPEKRVELAIGLAAKLQPWCEGVFGDTFATTTSRFPGFKRLIDQGRICVISLPEDRFGREICRRTALCLLSAFMDAALARTNPTIDINRERVVHLIIDEAHTVMSQRLADFTDVNRQSRTAVWLAHQSVGQIAPEYRHQVVANTRTKIALALNDMESAKACSDIFGTHRVKRETRSKGRTARGGGSVGVSTVEVEEPLFSPDDLWHLPQWQAVVKVFDGEQSQCSVRIHMVPQFQAEKLTGRLATRRTAGLQAVR